MSCFCLYFWKAVFTSWFHSIGNAGRKTVWALQDTGWYLQAMSTTHTTIAMVQVPEMGGPCSNTLHHVLQCISVQWFPISSHGFPSSSFASLPWTLSFNYMEITTIFILWDLVKIKLDTCKTMHAASETQYCQYPLQISSSPLGSKRAVSPLWIYSSIWRQVWSS